MLQAETVTHIDLRTEILVNFRNNDSFNNLISVSFLKFAFDGLLLEDNMYVKIQFLLANLIQSNN